MEMRIEVTMIVCWIAATLSVALGVGATVAIGFGLAGVVALALVIGLTVRHLEGIQRVDAIWQTFIVATVTAFLLMGVNFFLSYVSQAPTEQLYASGIALVSSAILNIGMIRYTKKVELLSERT